MSGAFRLQDGRAVDLRLDRVGQKTRCVGAVVQLVQLGSAGRVRRVKARDWAQLHMGDHQLGQRFGPTDTSSVDVMLLSKFTHLSAILIHILSHSSLSRLFATWNAAISMMRLSDAMYDQDRTV